MFSMKLMSKFRGSLPKSRVAMAVMLLLATLLAGCAESQATISRLVFLLLLMIGIVLKWVDHIIHLWRLRRFGPTRDVEISLLTAAHSLIDLAAIVLILLGLLGLVHPGAATSIVRYVGDKFLEGHRESMLGRWLYGE